MTIKIVVSEKYGVNDYGDGVAWIRGPLLGKGSYGRVYKATLRDPKSYRYLCLPYEMAVKSAQVSDSSTLRKERVIIMSLNESPYVIQCFGEEMTVGYKGETSTYNLLLEYASGGTLADRIKKTRGRGLSELEVKMHTRSILRGLTYIHGHGYVHCDLKPDNILLVPKAGNIDFSAKIGDFGLAKHKGSIPYWRGTPMYLSPEAVSDNVQEAPSDIWALGCVVLEMLTGKRAWEGRNKEEILRRIRAENEVPKIPNEVSKEARYFLMCCFQRDPICRLPSELLLHHPFLIDGMDCDDLFSDNLFYSPSSSDNGGSTTKAVYFDQANENMSYRETSSQGISERNIQFVLPYLE